MNNINFMVIVFIAILIGAVFIGVLGNMKYDATTPIRITNESITIASGISTLAHEGFINAVALHNATGTGNYYSGFTNGTTTVDYTGHLVTSKMRNGVYNITYNYGDTSTYVHNDRARLIYPLILVFFAIAILLYGIYWAKENLKDYI